MFSKKLDTDTEQSKKVVAMKTFELLCNILKEESIVERAVIGIGSGSTVMHFIEAMKANKNLINTWTCVPASLMTEQALIKARIHVGVLGIDGIDVAVDGADSVLLKDKILIKGGGCALMREKILIEAAKRVLIMIDETKLDKQVQVPMEVHPMAAWILESKLGGCIRMDTGSNRPVITDNGNVIIDTNLENVSKSKTIAGLLETGIFEWTKNMTIIVGMKDGSVKYLQCDAIYVNV